MIRSQEELVGRIQRCIGKGARVRFVDVNNHGFDVVDVVLIDGGWNYCIKPRKQKI